MDEIFKRRDDLLESLFPFFEFLVVSLHCYLRDR